jgi:multidrug efflux pump subunit AcrB
MKAIDFSLEIDSKLRKYSKTPSTVYSMCSSPTLKIPKQSLLQNLSDMHIKVAKNLKTVSDFLNTQVPSLHYRSDLAKIRLEKIKKHKEIAKKY